MSDLVRNESYIGKKYNFVGTVQTDLILETIGKVYIKQQNKMTRLDQLVEQIINKHQAESPIIILGEDQSIPLATYPGEGVLIYDPINQLLYITYDEDYMMLVDTGGKEIYVKLNGDTMTGQLQIELEDTTLPPLVVNTNVLVENLNSQYLNGYSSDDFLRQDTPTATISGDWTFNKTVRTNNGIQSSRFISGCNGSGFYISNNGDATVNNLTVRGTLSECNPSSSSDYEEQPEYISTSVDGELIGGLWLYLPEDLEVELLETNKETQLDYRFLSSGGIAEVFSLYKQAIDTTNPNENTTVYLNLQSDTYNLDTENEDTYLSAIISYMFDSSYYRLTFPEDYPTYLLNSSLSIGRIYKYYKYTTLDKTEAEYYSFIILNKVTCADGTESWIIKMSSRSLQRDYTFTKDCSDNFNCTVGNNPEFIKEGSEAFIILNEPSPGDNLVSYGELSAVEFKKPSKSWIELGSQGLNQGYLVTRISPTISTRTRIYDYQNNTARTGIEFSTGCIDHYNQEGDWNISDFPRYSTYANHLISENACLRTATDDINKTPPEGAQYTYTQQGYIIDDGMIKHFHRTQSNECMANRDGYLSNGIQLNKDGKLGYIGDLTDDSPYTDNIVEYHNNLITNNETITSILEQLTQLNQNLTQINQKITDLENRVNDLESGTSGDLSSLTTRVTNLEKNKLSISSFEDQIENVFNGGQVAYNNILSEYTLRVRDIYIKYGRLKSHDSDSRGTATFNRSFPNGIRSVVISGIRDGKGADGHNYVYNASRTGFDYQVDNCEAFFVAVGY